MADAYPKFIIQDGKLIIGKCTFHKQMANPELPVDGGGWFSFDSDTNTFTLYGKSEDFGQADALHIEHLIEQDNVFMNRRLYVSIAKQHKFVYKFDDDQLLPLN